MPQTQDFNHELADSHLIKRPLAICANALSFTYSNSLDPIVQIPKWQVVVGERVFLQGASGMGKSTLLQLLCGLRIGSGKLSVEGVELAQLSAAKRDRFRAQNIGVVFQQFNLIPYLSSLDNILLAASLAGRANAQTKALAQSLLSDTGLAPKLWQQRADTLSIGQQQRIAIARALINSPSLLLFDEPTSALDEVNRNLFMQMLSTYIEGHKNTTVIFVSHDTRLASYFDSSIALSELSSGRAGEADNHAH
ncbi:MAG: ATP-binding cassette domain-containing protein [Marinagarivorans sp.]|nr:ATP-binding cassette domain-containing protein [Marinagarivorans sp.]